jgi:hypothetical protein
MPVRELLTRISSAELTEWMAYERLTGTLDMRKRVDYASANVATTVYAMGRDPKRGKRPKLADFLVEWGRKHGAHSDEDMEALGRELASMYGGQWVEGEGVNDDDSSGSDHQGRR